MNRTGTQSLERCEVLGHTIALVFRESIAWMLRVELVHERVPSRLGEDRSGYNRHVFCVALLPLVLPVLDQVVDNGGFRQGRGITQA